MRWLTLRTAPQRIFWIRIQFSKFSIFRDFWEKPKLALHVSFDGYFLVKIVWNTFFCMSKFIFVLMHVWYYWNQSFRKPISVRKWVQVSENGYLYLHIDPNQGIQLTLSSWYTFLPWTVLRKMFIIDSKWDITYLEHKSVSND